VTYRLQCTVGCHYCTSLGSSHPSTNNSMYQSKTPYCIRPRPMADDATGAGVCCTVPRWRPPGIPLRRAPGPRPPRRPHRARPLALPGRQPRRATSAETAGVAAASAARGGTWRWSAPSGAPYTRHFRLLADQSRTRVLVRGAGASLAALPLGRTKQCEMHNSNAARCTAGTCAIIAHV